MAAKKQNWSGLTHEQHIELLAMHSVEKLANDYYLNRLDDAHFRRYLAAQHDLWEPENLREFEHAGGPPTKDVVLGA